ncbi:MAG: hypothetical protein AAFR64_08240 [Pseudomonadota bacterium]
MRLLFILCFASLSLAGPLHAQEYEAPTGTRMKEKKERPKTRPKKNQDDAEARLLVNRFGKCIFDRRKEQSVQLLSVSDYKAIDYQNLGSGEFILTNQVLMDDCLGRARRGGITGMAMTFSNIVLRNALTEAAYLDTYSKRETPIEISEDAPEFLANRFFVQGATYEDARVSASLADCVVHREPALAHAILYTKPGSDDEKEAVMAIVPAVSGCIPSGIELRLNVKSIRAFVADGLWARIYYGKLAGNSEGSD